MEGLLKVHLKSGKNYLIFQKYIFDKINLCFPSSKQSEKYLKQLGVKKLIYW